MTTGYGCASDNGEGDADGEGPADLENGAKKGNAKRFAGGVGGGKGEGRDGGDSREAGVRMSVSVGMFRLLFGAIVWDFWITGFSLHIEEDTSCFSHAFSEDTRTMVLEVELPLRDCLGRNYMPGQVLLESIAVSEFDIRRMQTLHMISFR